MSSAPTPIPTPVPPQAADGAAAPLPRAAIPVVHAVTTPELLARPEFPVLAARVMQALGPRGAVHLRGHDLPTRRLLDLATELSELQPVTGCWLVVNDRLDVALAAGARAAQLTSRSLRPDDARRAVERVGRPLGLGASVHAVAEARAAARAGTDWVVAGHVFETRSHPGEPPRGPGLVAEVAAAIGVPVIAIGGVLPVHVPALRAVGAWGVAVIRGVWEASDAERAATDYLASYDADARRGRD